jgi:hypothetical protein
LAAFLDRRERHHAWAVEQMRTLKAPLLVCEPVLTESAPRSDTPRRPG